jgi:hypothetical protein
MKKIIAFALIVITSLTINAQLANTKWKGTLNLDNPIDAFFNFKTDTLEVLNTEDNSNIESMKFSVNDSVLVIQKLFGQSQCDNSAIGRYKFQINGDEMTWEVMTDDCDDRSQVIGSMKLSREK